MITIRSLPDVGMEELYSTFSEAFKDYPVSWTADEFSGMLQRRGFDAGLSFGAFENGKLVSFTLNGIGEYSGHYSAYDTASGTIEDYRGKGLASQIFQHSVPYLKKKGITQYVLEVLQDNTKAVSVYTKAGFRKVRDLNVFRTESAQLKVSEVSLRSSLIVKEIDLSYLSGVKEMWDFYPSWQNSLESVMRVRERFRVLGAFTDDVLIGYGIIEPLSGDIPQLAVHPLYRNKGVGTRLLLELNKANKAGIIKVTNTDAAIEAVTKFLVKVGFSKITSQYEMVKELV